MVMELKLEVFGETELNRTMLRFTQAVEDMRPAFTNIHTDFLHTERAQFSSEGAAGATGRWAPLADSTVAYKAARGLDPAILVATGALEASLTQSGSEHHIYRVTPDTMFIGSSVDYGKFHQSRAPRTRLPRRPPVSLPENTKRVWVKMLQDHLVRALRGQ
jgi:phage gpG-like protein